MKKWLIIMALAIVLSGCTDAPKATKVLTSQGYTEVTITGYNFFGCGNEDSYHTGFRAKGLNGQIVSGTVCSGLFFKGSTVRFD